MSVLTRKLRRDLVRLWGQVITISLVLAFGMMAMLMMRSTFESLVRARDAYYAERRFADVSARLERAPESVARQLERLPGVAVVDTRVVEDVMVPLPSEPEPIPGRLVSLPRHGAPPLNDIHLRLGRLPAPSSDDEIVVLEQFAEAHRLVPGDRLPVVINGKLRQLQIVGIAISPEYVFAMAANALVADVRRFVVAWMPQDALAPAVRMEGAFNDVAIKLQPRASLAGVLAAADQVLAPYGGRHAYARRTQMSHFVLQGELDTLRSLAMVIPLVFLGVAAFLVNVVISRLVSLERVQIAVLKALGHSDRRIITHYLGFVLLIVALASILGLAMGVWAGRWMTGLYTPYFRFPGAAYHLDVGLVTITVAIALATALSGAYAAVRRVARLPPAEALRPPAPTSYKRELRRLRRVIGPAAMMIGREIARRPTRFAMSVLGISMGVAIYIMGSFSFDSFDELMFDVFPRGHREDLMVTFLEPVSARAISELEHLPGVELAEPQRFVAVRFRSGARWRDSVIIGTPERSQLRHIFDAAQREVRVPAEGLLMTDELASWLGVEVGDALEAEVLEGDFRTHRVKIAGLIDEPFGLQAYASLQWLHELLGQEPLVTTALVRVDAAYTAELQRALKDLPAVFGSTSTKSIIANYRAQTGRTLTVMTILLTLSAAAISVGIVYNNARIALSSRSRDLASLRVLGFTRQEISAVLLGELGTQVLLAVPLGLAIGKLWANLYAATLDSEAIRLPVDIAPETYGAAALIALVSGIVSALLVRRRLDELDLLAVLKAAE